MYYIRSIWGCVRSLTENRMILIICESEIHPNPNAEMIFHLQDSSSLCPTVTPPSSFLFSNLFLFPLLSLRSVLGGVESRGVLRKISDMLEVILKRMDSLSKLDNSSSTDARRLDELSSAISRYSVTVTAPLKQVCGFSWMNYYFRHYNFDYHKKTIRFNLKKIFKFSQ